MTFDGGCGLNYTVFANFDQNINVTDDTRLSG